MLYFQLIIGLSPPSEQQENNTHLTILPELPKKKSSRAWAALIKKIFEVDPLVCPKCGEQMSIKAFIHDKKEIVRLMQHLAIEPFKPPDFIPAPKLPDNLWL